MVQDERDDLPGEPPPWRDSLRRAREVASDDVEPARPSLMQRLAGTRPIIAWGVAAAVLVLFAAVLLYLYSRGGEVREPITVSADHAERRVKPDKEQTADGLPEAEVYDAIRPDAGGTATSASGSGRETSGGEAAESAAAPAAPSAGATASQPRKTEAAAPAPAPAPAAPRPADAPKSIPTDERAEAERALSGSYAVQVAAFHMRWRAESFVNKAAFDHRDVLAGLSAAIVPAEKDGQTFWRVRYGPFFDRASADAKCREIRARKLNCIVVRVP